ncbi:cupin domain-containing protein [Hydromonas duriensis]|uniref:(S)-ureidoglycine aminohydrolase cupin domain-containing protein n=1 Tax=Hydromonas duriensis TaxID=1527608 RepID=A0A4R6YBW1_9BURK|nr:cupin domain-containing protein [Hydromonas duriensis]TDR33091.1 hypothetical protein DFR44_101141 [Hydromonas duriensis]
MARIQLFSDTPPAPEYDHPRPDRIVSGQPKRTTWNHFTNNSGEVYMGIWSSEVGAWRIEMGATEDEYFFVTAGRGRIIAEDGETREFTVGDAVVIPAGFKGVFEVLDDLTKHYVISERKA